ncbi:MAG: hypothetical protein GTN36_04615 [Candidatus Aenigmarchaeota archaeon]|nr:hypothetical protein [Candidatus Aenigmarchaeota archaeon]
MSEEELIKLGFDKQVEGGTGCTYYYYTLYITSGLSFITQANDEIENGEWVVEIFESSEIKFKDIKSLTELINILNQNKDE